MAIVQAMRLRMMRIAHNLAKVLILFRDMVTFALVLLLLPLMGSVLYVQLALASMTDVDESFLVNQISGFAVIMGTPGLTTVTTGNTVQQTDTFTTWTPMGTSGGVTMAQLSGT